MARERATFIDWLMIAIGPILIMLMLGSLTFFLIEVLYAGQYPDRLVWTMFFYVVAIVLVSRISIEYGYARASVYGLGLGVATFLALAQFVEYPTSTTRSLAPFINVFLMLVSWWSANKLTWDCTHIDEDRKASGRGVLLAAGLGGGTASNAAAERARERQGETDVTDEAAAKAEAKKRKKDSPGLLGWMSRWDRHKEAQKKTPHTPGTWVVYFSLAALPIFGIGQSFIPTSDAGRRSATFYQMAVYVTSGLALLVTTSLLGLRKYLRERNAKIPNAMTFGWLGIGAGLILLFVIVGAVLPRPHSETPLINFSKAESKDRKASDFAMKMNDDAAGKGEGKVGNKQEIDKNAKAQGKKEGKGGDGGEKNPNGGGKNADNKQGDQQKGDQQKGDQKQGERQKGDQKQNQQQGKDANEKKNNPQGGNDKKDPQGEPQKGQDGEQQKAGDSERSGDNESSSQALDQALGAIGTFLKWIVWIVVGIAIIVGVGWLILKNLAPFTNWAKGLLDWLRGLFAAKPKRERASAADGESEEDTPEEPKPSLRDYANPFDNGTAKSMSLLGLIEYSFAAFEGWGWDHELGRPPDETPSEYAARVGEAADDLDQPGRKLANLYLKAMYSNRDLPAAESLKTLREFWTAIETAEPTLVSE